MEYLELFVKEAINREPRKHPVASIILHSTDGREAGDIDTLTGAVRGDGVRVSCHFYITRKGKVYQFAQTNEVTFHSGRAKAKKYGNHQSIGIEMEHFDGRENWPLKQVDACAKLLVLLHQKFGKQVEVTSHASVAYPKGRKQDPKDFPWTLLNRAYHLHSLETWDVTRRRVK